jgi:hypothetical protein
MDELPADRPQAPESTISLHPSLDIDRVITDLADKQTRLDRFLDRLWPAPDVEGIDRLFAVYSHNAARLGRLLRDRCKIYGPPLDDLSLAMDQALEEAWKHWEEFARSPD